VICVVIMMVVSMVMVFMMTSTSTGLLTEWKHSAQILAVSSLSGCR